MRYDFFNRCFVETESAKEKCAVAGTDGDLNWEELRFYTQRMADRLLSCRTHPDQIVLVFGHKEKFYPAAILACIHSATTYVPLDKIYPAHRLKSILIQTGAMAVINCTDEPVPEVLQGLIVIAPGTTPEERVSLPSKLSHDPLQYIMFTSGSTGEPKGVMIRRSATLSFIRWALIEFGFNREDVFMNQSPFTFDVSLCDLFCSFSLGGTLVLNSASQMKDQDGFLERIRKYQCTVWTSTPSFVYLFLRHPEFNRTHLSELRSMIFMGEELPARTCAHLFSSFPGIILANAYGPTEATIVTTHVFVTPEMANSGRNIPIGKAKTGALLRIIDPSTSAEGELQICGDHVSEGYYKKPEITSEKFIVKDGMKCYATGDLVRKEGDLFYFLGRNDDQVKFNGYRIEPDEISTVAITHSGVVDAVTIPLKRGNDVRKLILFIIPANPEEGTKLKKSLLDHLRIKLPYYMIPSDLVSLPEFPFNSSHKLDKIQLASRYMNGEFSSTPD